MTGLLAPPEAAAWRHRDARNGFEAVFHRRDGDGYRIEGETVAVEDGEAWAVGYEIAVDAEWRTVRARVISRSAADVREVWLETDGGGRWRIDDAPAPHLDGCLDVDLESSSYTNAPRFAFRCELVYDESGLVLEYPGLAVRAT